MSQFQRAFARAKLSGLPLEPPMPEGTLLEQNEEENDPRTLPEPPPDDDSSSASSASSTGTIVPSPSKRRFARSSGPLDPLPWRDYFSSDFYLENPREAEVITHHVYLTPPLGKGPLFVAHHGAGSSGLSFALFASEIRKALPAAGVLSVDARGHGQTSIRNRDDTVINDTPNLNLSVLSQDLVDAVFLTQKKLAWPELPDVVLMGHSLGGAVIADVAASGKLGNAVIGFAVIDVVEGSAIDALKSMESYLLTRPKTFPSLSSGIEWHARSRTIRNTTSARISVPSLLCQDLQSTSASDESKTWTWRTDLAATQPFWEGWFVGLSKKFLAARGGKLLLLAGTDRLDKELMIGQMQGKYQLQVFPEAGHFVHEDQAEKTAMVLADFYRRNDRSALVLPPKVGALASKQK